MNLEEIGLNPSDPIMWWRLFNAVLGTLAFYFMVRKLLRQNDVNWSNRERLLGFGVLWLLVGVYLGSIHYAFQNVGFGISMPIFTIGAGALFLGLVEPPFPFAKTIGKLFKDDRSEGGNVHPIFEDKEEDRNGGPR